MQRLLQGMQHPEHWTLVAQGIGRYGLQHPLGSYLDLRVQPGGYTLQLHSPMLRLTLSPPEVLDDQQAITTVIDAVAFRMPSAGCPYETILRHWRRLCWLTMDPAGQATRQACLDRIQSMILEAYPDLPPGDYRLYSFDQGGQPATVLIHDAEIGRLGFLKRDEFLPDPLVNQLNSYWTPVSQHLVADRRSDPTRPLLWVDDQARFSIPPSAHARVQALRAKPLAVSLPDWAL